MKLKRQLLKLCLALTITGSLNAQDYKIQAQNSKEGKLTLIEFPGDLPIEGYSGNEIIISSDQAMKTPERAKGLKPIYAEGEDNTGMGISVEKNGNQITLKCLFPIYKRAKYKIRVPDNFSLKIESSCGKSGEISIENIKNEVEIKNCQGIKLKNVSGPLVLSTISGDISVAFSELSKDKPISIAAISGDVDVTIPGKSAIDLEMSTVTGAFYSDFDFSTTSKELKQVGGSNVKKQFNGGGTGVKITNISGNIYLRKS